VRYRFNAHFALRYELRARVCVQSFTLNLRVDVVGIEIGYLVEFVPNLGTRGTIALTLDE
jgi:hypothetical protein